MSDNNVPADPSPAVLDMGAAEQEISDPVCQGEELRWETIDTAPRDGTHILACDVARPYDDEWTFMQAPPRVVHWWGYPGEEGFYLSAGCTEEDVERPYPATHWMSLPAPPRSLPAQMQADFDRLRTRWPDATIHHNSTGTYTVVVPAVPVEGFNVPTTDVTFVVPRDYPIAYPSDFRTTSLRLAHGGIPAYTTEYVGGDGLHWPHRLTFWDPERDSLLNYMLTVVRRIRPAPACRSAVR